MMFATVFEVFPHNPSRIIKKEKIRLSTVIQRFALGLHAVFRRAFGTQGPGPTRAFTAGSEALDLRAKDAINVGYRNGDVRRTAESLRLPLKFRTAIPTETRRQRKEKPCPLVQKSTPSSSRARLSSPD